MTSRKFIAVYQVWTANGAGGGYMSFAIRDDAKITAESYKAITQQARESFPGGLPARSTLVVTSLIELEG